MNTHGEIIRGIGGMLLLAAGAWAAPPTVYTLEQCVRFGLEHSPVARRARLEQDVARAQVGQAGAAARPSISMSATYTRQDEVQTLDLGGGPQPLGSLDNYEVSAGISQLLYGGGQVGAALRAARLAREYADAQKQATEAMLVRDLCVQVYGLLFAGEAVAVQAASVEQLRAYARQTETRHRNGAASEFDLLTANVRLANEMPCLIDARNQRELAYAALMALMNHPGGMVVTGSLEQATITQDPETLETLALLNRPELRRSDLLLGLGREAIVSARSAGLPSLRAFVNTYGANAFQFVSLDDDWEWHWNAGLALVWNLWDGDLTRQTVRRKRFEYEQLMADDEAVREHVRLEVRQAWLALTHAREALAAGGDSVALAERALDIARTRHETGLSTYLELTDANLALSTARLGILKARHDHAVAVINIRYACGMDWQGNPPPEP